MSQMAKYHGVLRIPQDLQNFSSNWKSAKLQCSPAGFLRNPQESPGIPPVLQESVGDWEVLYEGVVVKIFPVIRRLIIRQAEAGGVQARPPEILHWKMPWTEIQRAPRQVSSPDTKWLPKAANSRMNGQQCSLMWSPTCSKRLAPNPNQSPSSLGGKVQPRSLRSQACPQSRAPNPNPNPSPSGLSSNFQPLLKSNETLKMGCLSENRQGCK